ncbi:MAG: transglutaminase-like domain-containing protein [Pseudomonadota bacterium]
MTDHGSDAEAASRARLDGLTDLELHTLELLAQKKAGQEVAFVKIAAARTLCDAGLAVRSHEGWDITPLGSAVFASRAVPPTASVPVESLRPERPGGEAPMRLRCGFTIAYDCPAPTPMLLALSVHPSRRDDLETPDWIRTEPPLDVSQYLDSYGNICSRLTAPEGRLTVSSDFVIRDSGLIDAYAPDAVQHPVQDLPDEVMLFLLGSRYCETDRLSEAAWSLFGHGPAGWPLVQAITDYVHQHIAFSHAAARADKTAYDVWQDRAGVCRDYAHLAIALCRCMNIPARYCTGYLGDIGVPVRGIMDFSAWFEVYLGGRWHTFDARNNMPRMARVLIARGRDAVDVPIAHTFGAAELVAFEVVSAEALDGGAPGDAPSQG